MSQSKKTRPDGQCVNDVFEAMKDDHCEFFVNSQNEPTIFVPDDGFQKDWPADSPRIKDLVHLIYCESTGGRILSSSQEYLIMAHIREECRKGGRRLSETEVDQTDEDIIVQGMILLLNKISEYRGLTNGLLQRLIEFETLGILTRSEEMPRFVNIFSRRLRRQIPTLRGYGIDVILEHREEGSFCTARRGDTFQVEPDDTRIEPSVESSAVTSNSGKDLPLADDADGKFRRDRSRTSKLRSQSTSVNEGGAE